MTVDRNISRSLAQSAQVMNFIGGGLSMASSRIDKKTDKYILRLSVPGVDPEQFELELNNNHLFIFQRIHMDSIEIPYMTKNIIVPADVDLEEISASYHDGFLEVNMPINSEYAGGYRRKIDIDRF